MAISARYSIPANYVIVDYNGLKGIQRKGKNGVKWLWEPVYTHLIVSKTFGKILITHRSALSGEDFMRISDYKGDLQIDAPVYDVLFGEDFLYIRTIRPSTGQLEWCKVNNDFKGGLFLGDFEVLTRDMEMPYHVPKGRQFVIINANGEMKELLLDTGKILGKSPEQIEQPIVDMPVVPQNKYIPYCNVFINNEKSTVQLIDPADGRVVRQSIAIGELEAYTPIISMILGGLENIPIQRAEKLLNMLSKFEYYGNAIALPVLYQYCKDRSNGDVDIIIDMMVSELEKDWYDFGAGFKAKIYTSGSIILTLIHVRDEKILTAPYMIRGEDGILEVCEVEDLVNCYKVTGTKTAQLKITSAVLDYTMTDEEDTKEWETPYSIRQRQSMAVDVKEHKYQKIYVFNIVTNILGRDGVDNGDIYLNVAICDGFTYKSKGIAGGKAGEWVVTNNGHAELI